MPSSIPPLKKRKDDISLLISHFVDKYASQSDKEVDGVSKEAMDLLMKYDYPGNVRELENAMERAVVMARGTLVTTDDLPIHLRSAQSEDDPSFEANVRSLPGTLENLERHLITDALARTGGNQSKAAEALGISERNMRYRLKKYDMKT